MGGPRKENDQGHRFCGKCKTFGKVAYWNKFSRRAWFCVNCCKMGRIQDRYALKDKHEEIKQCDPDFLRLHSIEELNLELTE